MLVSAAYRIWQPPRILGSMAMLWGYFKSWITRKARYNDPEFRRFLRDYQRSCMAKGKTRATRLLNLQQASKWTQHSALRRSITPSPTAA
jgi:hypothetical protein